MEQKNPKQMMYDKAGPAVAEQMRRRRFDACYCATAAEAKEKILSLIGTSDTVGWGGSLTMDVLGITDALRARGQGAEKLLDRAKASSPQEQEDILRRIFSADVFLMSANAVTEDGILVNMDGNGNRVAAMIFGPKTVIVAVGMNKLTKTVEDAVHRVRSVAAPMNAQRFPVNTPCKACGMCRDCLSPDSICANLVVTRLSRLEGRIKVVLIGEDLGM